MNGLSFEFNSPMTKEDWDKLQDNEMEDTEIVIFNTPSGKRVPFRKVKHGEWEYDCICDMFVCSQCGGAMVRNVYPYCSWCGADMRERKKVK